MKNQFVGNVGEDRTEDGKLLFGEQIAYENTGTVVRWMT